MIKKSFKPVKEAVLFCLTQLRPKQTKTIYFEIESLLSKDAQYTKLSEFCKNCGSLQNKFSSMQTLAEKSCKKLLQKTLQTVSLQLKKTLANSALCLLF